MKISRRIASVFSKTELATSMHMPRFALKFSRYYHPVVKLVRMLLDSKPAMHLNVY